MRFKKQIVIICLFTFLFLPFGNVKEVKANPLAIPLTIGIKEVVTALLLSAGLVITDKYSHKAMVEEIYYKQLDNINEIVSEVQANKRFSLIDKAGDLLTSIKETYSYLKSGALDETKYRFSEKVSLKKGQYYPTGVGNYSISLPSMPNLYYIAIRQENGGYFDRIDVPVGSALFEAKVTDKGSTKDIIYYVDGKYAGDLKGLYSHVTDIGFDVSQDIVCTFNSTKKVDWSLFKEKNSDVVFPQSSVVYGGSISADSVLDWDKEWQGDDISYPLDKDYQGNVSIDKPSVDDSIDKPSVDDVVTPETGETLWDTLFGFLKDLFSPITNLLKWIGNILFGLLDGLKNLFIDLFVPSDGYFVDKFDNWKNEFSSKFFIDLSPLEDMKGLTEQGVKDIHFKIMGVDVVLKLSIINRIAEYSRTIALGVTVISLVWYNYRNAYKLIRGSSPIEGVTGHYGGEK